MQIANIYPVKNQNLYKAEKFVMILAHLVKKGYYDKSNFDKGQYVIMDNGLYEKAQVSTKLQDCIDLAESSGIPVNEIIIPDVVNNLDATIHLFMQSIDTIKKWQHKYKFMFVAQAKDIDDLSRAIEFINQYIGELNLTIGISKLSPVVRNGFAAKALYSEALFPIHFLGIKTTFKELIGVQHIIRSCDTSQLAFIAKNVEDINDVNTFAFTRVSNELWSDIDLERDCLDEKTLIKLRLQENMELYENGIL